MKVTFTFVRQQQVAVAAPSGDRAERESSLFLPLGRRRRRRPSDRQLESKLGNDGRRATAGYDDQISRERGEGEGGDGERERGRQAVTRPKPFPQKQNNRQNIVATVAAADGGEKDGRTDDGMEGMTKSAGEQKSGHKPRAERSRLCMFKKNFAFTNQQLV